jgi:hypothetical protein
MEGFRGKGSVSGNKKTRFNGKASVKLGRDRAGVKPLTLYKVHP